MPSDTGGWNSSNDSRSMGGYNDRPILDDPIQRHSGGGDLGGQSDRWNSGSSLTGMSSSLASGITQSGPPLNTMLGNSGSSSFSGGGGFNTTALGNLINSMNASAGSSSFGLDRHNMQQDNRFDSFQSSQGMRRF